MRRAQLRLRQLGTLVAIAIFVAAAAISSLPGSHHAGAGVRPAAEFSLATRPAPGGIRWRRVI